MKIESVYTRTLLKMKKKKILAKLSKFPALPLYLLEQEFFKNEIFFQSLKILFNNFSVVVLFEILWLNSCSRFPGQPPLPNFFSQNTETNHNTAGGDKSEPNDANATTQDTFSYFMRNMVNAMAQGNNVSFELLIYSSSITHCFKLYIL